MTNGSEGVLLVGVYVRMHGFEPLQQEQMIQQYAWAHGQITRNQAAELCGLSPDHADRVLRRLTAAGKLAHQGPTREGSTPSPPSRAR